MVSGTDKSGKLFDVTPQSQLGEDTSESFKAGLFEESVGASEWNGLATGSLRYLGLGYLKDYCRSLPIRIERNFYKAKGGFFERLHSLLGFKGKDRYAKKNNEKIDNAQKRLDATIWRWHNERQYARLGEQAPKWGLSPKMTLEKYKETQQSQLDIDLHKAMLEKQRKKLEAAQDDKLKKPSDLMVRLTSNSSAFNCANLERKFKTKQECIDNDYLGMSRNEFEEYQEAVRNNEKDKYSMIVALWELRVNQTLEKIGKEKINFKDAFERLGLNENNVMLNKLKSYEGANFGYVSAQLGHANATTEMLEEKSKEHAKEIKELRDQLAEAKKENNPEKAKKLVDDIAEKGKSFTEWIKDLMKLALMGFGIWAFVQIVKALGGDKTGCFYFDKSQKNDYSSGVKFAEDDYEQTCEALGGSKCDNTEDSCNTKLMEQWKAFDDKGKIVEKTDVTGKWFDPAQELKKASATGFIFYNYKDCDFNCALTNLVDNAAGVGPGGWGKGNITEKIGKLAFKWFIICLVAVSGYAILRWILSQALKVGKQSS